MLRDMEKTLDQLSTGVDIRVFQVEEKKGPDWNSELTELLGPVINELKMMSSRPRETEKLRNKIELHKSLYRTCKPGPGGRAYIVTIR
jgi:hypothetical protein